MDAALRDPAWRGRLMAAAVALLVAWPLLVAAEFAPWRLWDAGSRAATAQFLAGFWPPALNAEFLALVAREAWRTVAMATAGLTLAWLLALPMALLATRALSVSALAGRMAPLPALLRHALRALMALLRSVPELVWALLFVRVVGLGQTAGVLAIALTYAGMLAKVYVDISESGDAAPTRALLLGGAARWQALGFGLLPTHAAELASYTVYRWECGVRSSVVLGFVGAGGLGQLMDGSLKALAGDEVATLLLAFMLLVALADAVGGWLRRVLA